MNQRYFFGLLPIFLAILLLAASCQKAGPRVTEPSANSPSTNAPAANSSATQPTQDQAVPSLGQAVPGSQRTFEDAVVIPGQGSSTDLIQYPGQSGKTALDLLKAKYPGKVETKQSSFGEFVEGINGVKADSKHFWAFYINGEFANIGAGSYATKEGETLSWKLEEIKN